MFGAAGAALGGGGAAGAAGWSPAGAGASSARAVETNSAKDTSAAVRQPRSNPVHRDGAGAAESFMVNVPDTEKEKSLGPSPAVGAVG